MATAITNQALAGSRHLNDIRSPRAGDALTSIVEQHLPLDNAETFPKAAIHASRYTTHFGETRDALLSKTVRSAGNVLGGAFIGNALAFLSTSTGVNTALHEYVGHGLLGLELTHDYPEGHQPIFQVDGWDNFKEIFKGESFSDVMQAIWRFLTSYDFNGDGANGVTNYWNSDKNALGEYMGKEGHDAWVSIAGSIPSLVCNSLSVAGGMALKDKAPLLGWSMVSFGVMQHLMTSSYSWSAALMSPDTMIEKAASGHDFANFAVNMSEMTGLSSKAIAIGTSVAWTSLVPALAIGLYLHQKSQQIDIVPDHLAVQNLLFKSLTDEKYSKIIADSFDKYPRKKNLETLWKSGLTQNDDSFNMSYDLHLELRRYTEHLIQSLPKKTINSSKKEVLKRYAKLQTPDRAGQALSIVSIAGTIATLASRVLKVLGETIAPYLASAGTVLSYASPLLTCVSIISGGYETYKDLRSPTDRIPKRAKVVSVAKLVVNVVSSIGLAVGTLFSGLYIVAVAAVLLNLIGGVVLNFARQKMIKQRFDLLNSLETGNWNMMYNLLEIYKQDKGNIDISRKDSSYRGLYRWVKHQNTAFKKGFLKENQAKKLQDIGLLTIS